MPTCVSLLSLEQFPECSESIKRHISNHLQQKRFNDFNIDTNSSKNMSEQDPGYKVRKQHPQTDLADLSSPPKQRKLLNASYGQHQLQSSRFAYSNQSDDEDYLDDIDKEAMSDSDEEGFIDNYCMLGKNANIVLSSVLDEKDDLEHQCQGNDNDDDDEDNTENNEEDNEEKNELRNHFFVQGKTETEMFLLNKNGLSLFSNFDNSNIINLRSKASDTIDDDNVKISSITSKNNFIIQQTPSDYELHEKRNLPNVSISENTNSLGISSLCENLNIHSIQQQQLHKQASSSPLSLSPSLTDEENCLHSKKPGSTDHLLTSCVDEDQNTELHIKIQNKQRSEALDIIARASTFDELNTTNIFGQTPLHLAVISKEKEIVRRLMCAGSIIYLQDIDGNTPLHVACQMGCSEIAKILITPIGYQERQKNKLNYQVPFCAIPQDLGIQNEDGFTCFDLADQPEVHHVIKRVYFSKHCD